jgi:hypothetical protein
VQVTTSKERNFDPARRETIAAYLDQLPKQDEYFLIYCTLDTPLLELSGVKRFVPNNDRMRRLHIMCLNIVTTPYPMPPSWDS